MALRTESEVARTAFVLAGGASLVLPTQDPALRGLPLAPRGALGAAVHAFVLLVDARLRSDLARYAEEAELILLTPTNPAGVQPTDFDQADRLIRAALEGAGGALRRVGFV